MSIIEENIINKEVHQAYRDELGCDICLGILVNPKQCSSCQTNYCSECISGWEKKNKSCPMRCHNYKIEDSPRVIKNMLSKLIIKCDICEENIGYDILIKDHLFGKCKASSKVCCPLCKSKIPSSSFGQTEIDNYNDSVISTYESEIIKLRNEIKSYKEVINILSSEQPNTSSSINPIPILENKSSEVMQEMNEVKKVKEMIKFSDSAYSNKISNIYLSSLGKLIDLKWRAQQKKQNHTFSNSMKTATINYSSCWNFYLTDYYFNKDFDEVFAIKLISNSKSLTHHYIGFMNDSYGSECLCLYNKGAFFLHQECENFKEGKKVLFSNPRMKWDSATEKTFIFKIRGSTGQVSIYSENKELYGEYKMEGKNFIFFVAKCNTGNFEYSLLP